MLRHRAQESWQPPSVASPQDSGAVAGGSGMKWPPRRDDAAASGQATASGATGKHYTNQQHTPHRGNDQHPSIDTRIRVLIAQPNGDVTEFSRRKTRSAAELDLHRLLY